jgi:uncharacterized protein
VKISVEQISDKPITLQAEESVELFPLLVGMQGDGVCTFTSPVRYGLTVVREYDHLRVAGNVNVMVSLTCSRCLAAFESSIDSSFTIFFRRGTPQEAALEEETELSEQDLISAFFCGDEIDLSHEIAEQIAMEVPLRPLCGGNCKGLCPECGTDLNHSSCSCSGKQFNFKFSALKDFKASR